MAKINFYSTREISKQIKDLSKEQTNNLGDGIHTIAKMLLSADPGFESGDWYITENNPIKLGNDHYIISMRLTINHLDDMTAEIARFDKVTKEEADEIFRKWDLDDNNLKS